MIVVDTSAAIAALLNDGEARRLVATESVAVPHLADSEVANGLRSKVARSEIDSVDGAKCLAVWSRLGVRRMAVSAFLDRIWELRHNLSAYDATYVALAEALDCGLVTNDARLAGAPGIRCSVTVVRTR